MSVSTNQLPYLNELNYSCLCHIINILLTKLSQSVWKNLDLGRVYRPHCVRSVLTTSVKILPYRPPARLIRAKDPPPPLNFQFLDTNVPSAHTQKYFLRYDVHPHTLAKNSFWQVKVKIAVYYF